AVGRVILFGREELVLVRPVERVLAMTALKYEAQVAHAAAFNEELERTSLAREELNLTQKLLEAFEKPKFSLADFKDHYVEQWKELMEAKVDGKKVVAPPSPEEPHVINRRDALKKRVAAEKKGGREDTSGRKRKAAASHNGRAKRRKKTA